MCSQPETLESTNPGEAACGICASKSLPACPQGVGAIAKAMVELGGGAHGRGQNNEATALGITLQAEVCR